MFFVDYSNLILRVKMVRVCNNINDYTGGHSCVLVSVDDFGVDGCRILHDNRALRPINMARVKELMATTRKGQDVIRFSRETVLVVMVNKESVDESSLSTDLRNDMPLFRFKPDAEDKTMRIIDGNHRREMMLISSLHIRDDIEAVELELAGTGLSEEKRREKKSQLGEFKNKLSRFGRWGVMILYKREHFFPLF